MKNIMIATFTLGLVGAGSASAMEVTGGSVKLSYSAFVDDTSVSKLGLEGSIEFGFNQNFALQADLAHQSLNETDIDSNAFGLHGIYHLDDATSFGAFYVREDIESVDVDIIGIEGGYETGLLEFEGYLGKADVEDEDVTLFGISARYELANEVGLTGSFDLADQGLIEVSRFGLKLDRDVSANLNLFVEVGSAELDIAGFSDDELFVGIGGKISFGADRGATFEQRGLARLLPGL
ncbi:MAG: porin [Sulfitobacter sp.]